MQIVRNTARADAVIAFIEKLKITVGKDAGQPFRLAEFQKAFIRDVYEPALAEIVDVKLVTKGVLSVGRKNGKSELAAALVLAHLIGPEAETNGQIISGATTHKQARVVFDAVVRFLNASPTLYRYLRVVDSTSTIYVKVSGIKAAGSQYRAIAAGPGAAQGLNPSLIIMDELAQAGNRKFYDAMISSQGARPQPFMMVISTQNEDPMHVLSTTIDDGLRTMEDGTPVDPRTVVHLFAAKPGCDLLDEAEWYRANPGLGLWIDLERFRAEAETARRNPAEEAQFRLYRLNQRVSPNAPLIGSHDWRECGPYRGQEVSAPVVLRTQADFEFDDGERLWGGLDMSSRSDLSGLVMVSDEDPARVKAWGWKPEEAVIPQGLADAQRYDLHVERGWLKTTPGRTIDPAFIVQHLAGLHARHDILAVAYDRDPKHMDELLRVLEREGLDAQFGDGSGLKMVPWGQGTVGMDVGVTALETAILSRKLLHDGNPLLTWNIANAAVRSDEKGNRKLIKLTPRFRIDLAVCLAMAMGLRATEQVVKMSNPWEDPTFSLRSWLNPAA